LEVCSKSTLAVIRAVAQLWIVRRMRHVFLILALFVTGCSTTRSPILLCPPSCKAAAGDWTSLRECLFEHFKKDGVYWLTDSAGQPVDTFRYRHDHGLFESDVMPLTISKEAPASISTPIILKRGQKGVVLHLICADKEQTILLDGQTLERHGDYDVLYVQ
jgi:hypothetical protein